MALVAAELRPAEDKGGRAEANLVHRDEDDGGAVLEDLVGKLIGHRIGRPLAMFHVWQRTKRERWPFRTPDSVNQSATTKWRSPANRPQLDYLSPHFPIVVQTNKINIKA
jgi:hypothetical protein